MRRKPSPELLLGKLPDRPALLGVSGGRDSVALLHALAAAHVPVTVCHLDHALRPESRDDAEFVRALADKLGCPHLMERSDVAEIARAEKISIETAARRARHYFFARAAKRFGCHDVILAHHADDQVETFLLNLFRGTGSTGLRGIQSRTTHIIEGISLEFHRPLLGVWRKEIDAYITHHGLEYREDDSNRDPAFTRNRVRHEILPMLSQAFGRDVSRAIWKAAEIHGAEQEWLKELGESLLQETPTLKVADLKTLPIAAQRRVLRHWLRYHNVPEVGFDDVEAVRGLLSGGAPAKVNLPERRHARRRSGILFIETTQAPPVV